MPIRLRHPRINAVREVERETQARIYERSGWRREGARTQTVEEPVGEPEEKAEPEAQPKPRRRTQGKEGDQ